MNCKKCNSTNTVKNGIIRNKQRYLCKDCGCNFTVGDKRKQDNTILKYLCQVLAITESYERIAWFFDVSKSTVCRWVKESKMNVRYKPSVESYRHPSQQYFLLCNKIDEKYTAVIVVSYSDTEMCLDTDYPHFKETLIKLLYILSCGRCEEICEFFNITKVKLEQIIGYEPLPLLDKLEYGKPKIFGHRDYVDEWGDQMWERLERDKTLTSIGKISRNTYVDIDIFK